MQSLYDYLHHFIYVHAIWSLGTLSEKMTRETLLSVQVSRLTHCGE